VTTHGGYKCSVFLCCGVETISLDNDEFQRGCAANRVKLDGNKKDVYERSPIRRKKKENR